MTRTAKKRLIILGMILAGSMGIVAWYFWPGSIPEDGNDRISVYFFQSASYGLRSETRARPTGTQREQVAQLISYMQAAPRSSALNSTWPGDEILLGFGVRDGAAVLRFSSQYLALHPLDEAFFRSSLILTLGALPFIHAVEIYVEGIGQIGLETLETVSNNPLISYAPLSSVSAKS